MEKKCTLCSETKSLKEFAKSKQTKSGYGAWCKSCTNIKRKESSDRVRKEQGEAWEERRREYVRAYKQRHPDKVKEQQRARSLSKFGLTVESYESMLESQKGRCAICYDIPRNKRFAVDHDHACCPGKYSCGICVRQLLCSKCNTALGLLYEDENIINAMLGYVKKWK